MVERSRSHEGVVADQFAGDHRLWQAERSRGDPVGNLVCHIASDGYGVPALFRAGVKGFTIDFIDRDDQVAISSTYAIAAKAAQYHLLVDYHGTSKPAGLQRTWPNVIGYEGVKGLENFKWANEDQPRYVASIPYIRMMAGPMDYTPGAMRNATQPAYRPINDNPMSKGTRCQQLAEYVVFDAPLQMLADNPT